MNIIKRNYMVSHHPGIQLKEFSFDYDNFVYVEITTGEVLTLEKMYEEDFQAMEWEIKFRRKLQKYTDFKVY